MPSFEDYQREVQAVLDAEAQTKNYDDIKSLALRAAYAGPWQAEGLAGATWMEACWSKCYQIMTEVMAATRPQPTVAELLAELPIMEWPV